MGSILPLEWIAILGIRFGGYPITIDDMSFEIVCELFSISLPLTEDMRAYFWPTTSPQIRTEWLQGSIFWDVALIDIHLW